MTPGAAARRGEVRRRVLLAAACVPHVFGGRLHAGEPFQVAQPGVLAAPGAYFALRASRSKLSMRRSIPGTSSSLNPVSLPTIRPRALIQKSVGKPSTP